MRIAFAVEAYLPHIGGTEVRVSELASRLPSSWDIEIYAPRFDNDASEESTKGNISIHRLGHYESLAYFRDTARPISSAFAFGRLLRKALRDGGTYDIVHFSEWNLLHFRLARGSVNGKVISDWCEVLGGSISGYRGWIEERLERYMAGHSDMEIAINEKIRELLITRYKVDPSRVSVVHNGLPETMLSQECHKDPFQRLLFVGRLVPHKQCDMLIRAVLGLRKRGIDLELRVVGGGDGEYLSYLKSMDARVEFLGAVSLPALMDEYRRASVLVLPSIREGSSLVALEAMGSCTPVITVDAPLNHSPGDVVHHDIDGLVVENSEQGLTNAIEGLIRDPGLYRRLSVGAHETAKQRTWGKSAEELVRAYERLLDPQIPRASG